MPVPGLIAAAPAILGAASNAAQFVKSIGQEKRDKEELARLHPAYYKVQNEYFGNRNSALETAQSGLPQASKDLFTDQLNRGLGTGISAINEGGGTPNDIAQIFDSYSQGLHSLSSEDAQRQIDNIRYFHQTNKDLAGQKTIQWDINEYQPYQNKLKELTQRIAADKLNKNSAVSGFIGSAQAGITGMQNNALLGKLFGDGKGGIAELDPALKTFATTKATTIPDDVSTDPTGTYKAPTNNWGAMQAQSYLNSLSEEDRNMILQGYYNK